MRDQRPMTLMLLQYGADTTKSNKEGERRHYDFFAFHVQEIFFRARVFQTGDVRCN